MSTNLRIDHQQLTATQVLVSAGAAPAEERQPRLLARIAQFLVAPAVVAVLMLGAHWSVYGSVAEPQEQVVEDGGADAYFPAEYAFRAADFDDPANYR